MAMMMPKKCVEAHCSNEKLVFNSLKNLPDDYYVFYSYCPDYVDENNVRHCHEIDFLVFHQQLGMIIIEAKSGINKPIAYSGREWGWYDDGAFKPMPNGGPFLQAKRNRRVLINYIKEKSTMPELSSRFNVQYAVWFHTTQSECIDKQINSPEIPKEYILTADDLVNTEEALKRIFNIQPPSFVKHQPLSDDEAHKLVYEVLCPHFFVFPMKDSNDVTKTIYGQLTQEQIKAFTYMEENHRVSVSGMAGTGKTILALEKAKRLANNGDKVLFLCYNKLLAKILQSEYPNKNIEYINIDKWVSNVIKSCNGKSWWDYDECKKCIRELHESKQWKYSHLIIDEAQDFGIEDLEKSGLINEIVDIIFKENEDAVFYAFYDENQAVYNNALPKFLDNMECKLRLSKNCRSSKNILMTAVSLFDKKTQPKLDTQVLGVQPEIYFCDYPSDCKTTVNRILKTLKKSESTVILSMATESSTYGWKKAISDGTYKGFQFSTCRRFKGCEADNVILVDVGGPSSMSIKLFYIGASRARIRLFIVGYLKERYAVSILKELYNLDVDESIARDLLAEKLHVHSNIM